jgi:organic hydroperoxide reductase OsmC/OhrA
VPCFAGDGKSTHDEGTNVEKKRVKSKVYLYDGQVRWNSEKRGVLALAEKPELEVASPPEFRGHAGLWTPEDLLVQAVNSCTMMTFLSSVARKDISLVSYECDATGTLEMADGTFRFTRIVLSPRIVVERAEDVERASAAFVTAEAGCLVTNSLLTEVEGEPHVTVRDV